MLVGNALSGIAHALEDRIEEIAETCTVKARAEVPTFFESRQRADPLIRVSGHGANAAIRDVLYGLIHGRRSPELTSGAAAQDACLAARAGIDVRETIAVYRIGQRVLWGEIVREASAQIDDPGLRTAALLEASRYHDAWTENAMSVIARVHQTEAELLVRVRERRDQQVVRDILDGLPADPSRLAYDVAGCHLALVLAGRGADQFVVRLAERLGCSHLAVTGVEGTVFGWLGGPQAARLDSRALAAQLYPEGLRIAYGTVTRGVDGFRITHRQAREAWRVARLRPQPLTGYRDVAVEALLLADESSAWAFVVEELGPLLDDEERMDVLRSTLKEYFACGHSAVCAGQVLNVHERTVAYRVRTAGERLGVGVIERRDELSLALRLLEYLGGPAAAADHGDSAARYQPRARERASQRR